MLALLPAVETVKFLSPPDRFVIIHQNEKASLETLKKAVCNAVIAKKTRQVLGRVGKIQKPGKVK